MSSSSISHILERLPSHSLLSPLTIQSLSTPDLLSLIHKFNLEETIDDSDIEDDDLRDVLCAFSCSFNDSNVLLFHQICELLIVFPQLDFEFIQSMLESNDGKISRDMIEEFAEMSGLIVRNSLSGTNDNVITNGNGTVTILSVSEVLATSTPLVLDRKSIVMIIDDDDRIYDADDGDATGNKGYQVMGLSLNNYCGLHFLHSKRDSFLLEKNEYMEWGINDIHIHVLPYVSKPGSSADTLSTECGVYTPDRCCLSKQVYVTSEVFDYSYNLEMVFDIFHYGWCRVDGATKDITWTPALEDAMLHLLIAVDDDLVMLVKSWKSMMTAFESMSSSGGSQGMSSDLENMLQMVQSDATDALRTQSANAIGRLHQVLSQFVEMAAGPMGAMVRIPELFLHSIEQFVLAKLQASKTMHISFIESFHKLIRAGKLYRQHLISINFRDTLKIGHLTNLLSLFEPKLPTIVDFKSLSSDEKLSVEAFFLSLCPSDIKILEALKPSQLDSLITGTGTHYDSDSLCFMPALSLQDIAEPQALTQAVTSLAEKTYNDAITLGVQGEVSLGGYTMTPENRSVTCAMLSSLLNAGVAYVATKETAKLMGHLPMLRSTLLLQPKSSRKEDVQLYLEALPPPLKKRCKDMKRIFRNKIKKKLSFRVNFDVRGAISLLREHHGIECWVGQELEQVWLLMAATSPPQLMVFELYYGNSLVAADFAHPVRGGKSVYVATRFSARGHSKTSSAAVSNSDDPNDELSIRTMQPGFILALLECQWLQDRGCRMWDLGGYNLSPLMQYKLDLAGTPQTRPYALYEFRRKCIDKLTDACPNRMDARDVTLFSDVRSGDVLIDDVKIQDLLGHRQL